MVLKKDSAGYRISNPRDGIPASQLTRPMPVADNNSNKLRGEIRKFAEEYAAFSTAVRTAYDVTNFSREYLQKNNFDFRRGIFMTESDDCAFAAIKYGTKPVSEGIRILFSHNDSCGLKLKTKSPKLQWDPDLQSLHLGIELDTTEYGGIIAPQWAGHQYIVKGYMYRDARRKEIEFRGFIPDINDHTDLRRWEDQSINDAYKVESLDLVPGYNNIKNFLKAIGLKSESEFQKANLQIYPDEPTRIIGQGFISGYAHDARVGIFSGLKSFSETTSPYTTVMIGFDKEETGSKGAGGADSVFLEDIIDRLIMKSKLVKSESDLTEALKREIYKKSLAINIDVDVCANNLEDDADPRRIDISAIPKMAYGPFLFTENVNFAGTQSTRKHIDRLMNILRDNNIIFQTTGNAMAEGNVQVEGFEVYFNNRGIPAFNFGVPVSGTHSKNEVVHEGDLYFSYLGNNAFLKAPWRK